MNDHATTAYQRYFKNAFAILRHKVTCMGSGKFIHCYLRNKVTFWSFYEIINNK